MTFLVSALAFFILLSVLVFIHELGHFMAARKAGIVVEEFGLGLPPRGRELFRSGGTLFSLNWIPFGGFVRLQGENAMDPTLRNAQGSFAAASVFWRIIVLVAGVVMNILLAIALFTIGFASGSWVPWSYDIDDLQAAADRGEIIMDLRVGIAGVVEGGPAELAGVPASSIIESVNGQAVETVDDVVAFQEGKTSVTYSLRSGEGFLEETTVTVELNEEGQAGILLSLIPLELESLPRSISQSLVLAAEESWFLAKSTVMGIGNLLTTLSQEARVPEGISSIVGIAEITHVSVQQGFMHYLRLMAVLSLSLAALNILPFPPLDGGRLLFVAYEAVLRHPPNRRFEVLTNEAGFVFLLLLIILITFNDIARLF